MSSTVYATLEIGTSRTVLAIGESEAGEEMKLVSFASIPSTGVRKSQIIDINQATQSVRSVIGEIERKSKAEGGSIDIANAFLVINGSHVNATPLQSATAISGRNVTQEDVDRVTENARQIAGATGDLASLDIAEQDYAVDNMAGILNPLGMSGRALKLNVLHLTADKNRIQDAKTAADGAHLELRDPLFACTCAAEAVLDAHEKKNGVLVLDLGGGSTGYAVYDNEVLVDAGSIGVGGDHVTNDIVHAFSLPQSLSEVIKRRHAQATIADDGEAGRIVLSPSSSGGEERSISRRSLSIVVNARMKELIAIIREHLEEKELLARLHCGVVLCGGGAQLRELDTLIQEELGIPAKIGIPKRISGLPKDESPALYATAAGALLAARAAYPEEHSFFDTLKGIFK